MCTVVSKYQQSCQPSCTERETHKSILFTGSLARNLYFTSHQIQNTINKSLRGSWRVLVKLLAIFFWTFFKIVQNKGFRCGSERSARHGFYSERESYGHLCVSARLACETSLVEIHLKKMKTCTRTCPHIIQCWGNIREFLWNSEHSIDLSQCLGICWTSLIVILGRSSKLLFIPHSHLVMRTVYYFSQP